EPKVSNSDKPEEAKSKEPKVSKSEKPEASEFEQHEVIKPEETEESKSEEPKVSNSDKPEEAKSKEPQVSKSEKPEASESEQYEVIKPEETEESKSEQLEVTRQDISKKPVVFKSTQVFPSSLFFLDLKKYSLSFAQIFEVENSGTEIGVLEIKEDPLTQTVVNSLGLSQNSNKPKKPTKLEKTQQDPAVFRNAQALFALFFLDPTGSLSLPHLFTKGSSIGDSAVRPDVKGNYDDSVRSSATNFSKLSKTNEKPGKAVVSVGAKAPSSLRSFDLKNSSSSEQNVLLTDTEKMKVANLLTELCKTVPCHDQKEGKDMLSMLRNFLIHVKGKDFKSEDLKEYMQNLKDGFNHASEKSAQADGHVFVNPSFASSESGGKKLFTNNNERLSEIEKMKGQSPHGQHPATNPAWFLANVVPSSYTTPHLEFSRELAQAVVTGLRNTETFVRETIFSAKENIQQGVLHNAIKVSSSLQEKRLPVSTLKTTPGIGEEGSFITIDSVVIGKEVAAAHALMNPPKILHPFMRWLLYQKYMTPSVIKQATQTRQKVERLYAEAKAKNLKVRYNDQIHDAYLPLPDEAGGEYAIVKLVAATSK
ncbi:MAG TPA: hypothetical protein PLO78_05530, partial [Candidatus Omnitrophota bacterium]|nr:hypothetical protein [Candidatus Omnitrophota bacterium]